MKEFTLFEAFMKPLTQDLIEESIKRFDADHYCKTFKTKGHLISMAYAQLQGLQSLRDLEIAFNSQKKLRVLLECGEVRRSTLSDANRHRPFKCFLWIAEKLMSFLPRKIRQEVNLVVRKLDSSPIQLRGKCYDSWTWANRSPRSQGLKLHIEYDGELEMPMRVRITPANRDDCRVGQEWPMLSKTVYVFDKGYYDFNWWWAIHQKGAFFVTRLKHNAAFKKVKDLPVCGEKIREDSLFVLKNKCPRGGKKNKYTDPMRRVVVNREEKEKPLVLVSNLTEAPAEVIADLYKERWGIELFFKWIKQNLKIRKFLGRSENAVKIQLAVALIVYLLLGIFKWTFNHPYSLRHLLIWIKYNIYENGNIYKIMKPPGSPLAKDQVQFQAQGCQL